MRDFQELIRERLRKCKLSPVREAEIVDEMAEHLRDRYQALRSAGASDEEALRAVTAELEQRDLAQELSAVEQSWIEPIAPGSGNTGGFWRTLWQDVRYGLRVLRLNPGFALICALSLALGIGANTAIFQLIDAVRMRTLPVKDPQRLVNIDIDHEGRSGTSFWYTKNFSNSIWKQIRDQQQGFSSVAAWGKTAFNLNTSGEAKYARGLWVSGSFFEVLGIEPVLGRLFSPQDDQPGCGPTGAVLSYAFWQREYGGQATTIGQELMLQGHPFQIIGVTPSSFSGLLVGEQFDIALPLCAENVVDPRPYNLDNPTYWFLDAIGRLKPDWTLRRASAQLETISPAVFSATLPAVYDAVDREKYLKFRLHAVPAATGVSRLREQYDTPLWLLLGISGLVLLIACANIATMMMARASVRQREIAVRLALGASRGRVIHQLAAESLLLAAIGALGGVIIAQILSRTLVSFLNTQGNAIFLDLQPDWRVLAFTVAVAAITCLLFGLVPTMQAAQTPPAEAMKAGGRGITTGLSRFRVRRAVVIAQVSISLLLLTGALLFARTFNNLLTVNPGFDPDRILVTEVDFSSLKLPEQRMVEYREELLERVRAIPGVLGAAENKEVLLSGSGWNDYVSIEGTSIQRAISDFNSVTPGYFATLRIPLLAGRDFTTLDSLTSPRVAIVNETFARQFFGGASPVGRTFKVHQEANHPYLEYQVIGLAGNTKYLDLREDFPPIAFVAMSQRKMPEAEATIMIRSNASPANLVPAIRNALSQATPQLVLQFTVLKTAIGERLTRERLMAMLAGFFGGLAVLLAMIGVYGVISYMVVRRRNEIGIRMALGATRGHILAMVVSEAGKLLLVGIAIGAGLTLAAAPAARAFLYGLKPGDPLTLAIAALSLATVALLASFLPARRAAGLNPMAALRDE
jgi:putative ABC transport system permease protein